jgi:hypothetical protein
MSCPGDPLAPHKSHGSYKSYPFAALLVFVANTSYCATRFRLPQYIGLIPARRGCIVAAVPLWTQNGCRPDGSI